MVSNTDQQPEVSNKTLGRIKKMLALANDPGATEHERDTALQMAYKLLAKHNLQMSDLPGDASNEPREQQNNTISADKWARNLSGHVAKLFFCKYFYSTTRTSGKDNHHFVGKQSNVVTAMYMAEYLIKAIKREATRRYKSPTTPEGRSFCVGTVHTIGRRVEEMQKQDQTDDAGVPVPGTALALVKLHDSELALNMAFLENGGISLTKPKARADNSLRSDAYRDGRAHGKTVSLNQQVGTSAATKRTLIGN